MSQTNAPTEPTVPVAALNEWLQYAGAEFAERGDAILATLVQQTELYTTIPDDGTFEVFSLNRKMATTFIKDVEAFHAKTKASWLAGGRAVDALRKKLLDPLMEALAATIREMTEYLDRQERIARDLAHRIAAEKREQAEEAAKRAREELLKLRAPDLTREALARAEEAAKAADQAKRLAEGNAGDLVRKRSPYGTTDTLRTTWGYEVTNFEEVRNGLKIISDAAVKEVMKDRDPNGRPRAVEPGITWVQIRGSTQTG